MWHNIINHCIPGLIGASAAALIMGLARHKTPAWILLMVLALALVISVPEILFGYFPELGKGWHGFAISIGIAVLISVTFAFFAQRFSLKHSHDA